MNFADYRYEKKKTIFSGLGFSEGGSAVDENQAKIH
jgi:hypothetical protein